MTGTEGVPEGSARGLIAFALLAIGWIAFLADLLDLNPQGLAVLGAVLIGLALWILRVFTREFWNRQPRRPREPWVANITEDHPDALGSLDLADRANRQENHR